MIIHYHGTTIIIHHHGTIIITPLAWLLRKAGCDLWFRGRTWVRYRRLFHFNIFTIQNCKAITAMIA
jgi:hypothetical protein